jgi:hypothetical protein
MPLMAPLAPSAGKKPPADLQTAMPPAATADGTVQLSTAGHGTAKLAAVQAQRGHQLITSLLLSGHKAGEKKAEDHAK